MPLGTEWWCRRAGRLTTVSVDAVTDEILAAADAVPRSIWIFDLRGAAGAARIPARLASCQPVVRNAGWSVLACAGGRLAHD